MKVQIRAIAYGIAALALAGAIVFAGSSTGLLPLVSPAFNPSSRGVLSIMVTDPPSLPAGVSAVFVSYTGLAVHVNGLGDGGWVETGARGTLDAPELVNLTQTVSSGSVPSGSYDMVRLDISEVQVTFFGVNYSATINSGRLIIPVVGGLEVNTSAEAAAVVDIRPTVLNLGNQSVPQFMITTGAKAVQVPSADVVPAMRQVGSRTSIAHRPWYGNFTARHSDNLTFSSVSLTSASLVLSLSNPTSDQVTVNMILVTQGTSATLPGLALGRLAESAVFSVSPDGSIHPVTLEGGTGNAVKELRLILQGEGLTIASGGSATFTYSGSFLSSKLGISTGSPCQVLVIGQHLQAATVVQAS